MKIYNNIIAGSGPTGCHIFNKIRKDSVLVTGETTQKIPTNSIHPKVRVNLDHRTNKFANLIYSKENKFSIYSSSEIAGLTNYWGQQFFNYRENEYWPKIIFKRFSLYKKNLKILDKLYPSDKIKILKKKISNGFIINQFTAPLLKSPIVKKSSLKKIAKKKLIHDRIISFKKIKKNLIKVNTEKNIFYCKNLILCAGPVGNALILLKSFKKINHLKFRDDNPRLLFGIKTEKNSVISDKKKLSDVEIMKNNKSILYSTIYNFNPDHFNFFFKPFINTFKNILTRFFYYGLFWTADEYNEISLTLYNNKIFLSGKNINFKKERVNMIKQMSNIGLKVLKIWNLKFAYGFHYHGVRINFKGKLLTLNDFLNKMELKNNIHFFDSSVINKISNKPPTKTYLAASNYLIQKFINKNK